MNPRSKRFRLGLAAALLLLLGGGAGAAEPAASATPDVAAATKVVETLHAAMLGVMKQGVQLGYAGRLAKLQPAISAASPDRAWARASAAPQALAYRSSASGAMVSTAADCFPSQSWRT